MFNNIISIQRITLDRGKSIGRPIYNRGNAAMGSQQRQMMKRESSLLMSEHCSQQKACQLENVPLNSFNQTNVAPHRRNETMAVTGGKNIEDLQFYQRTRQPDPQESLAKYKDARI